MRMVEQEEGEGEGTNGISGFGFEYTISRGVGNITRTAGP